MDTSISVRVHVGAIGHWLERSLIENYGTLTEPVECQQETMETNGQCSTALNGSSDLISGQIDSFQWRGNCQTVQCNCIDFFDYTT